MSPEATKLSGVRRALHLSSASAAGASLLSLGIFGYELHTLVLVALTVAVTGAMLVSNRNRAT